MGSSGTMRKLDQVYLSATQKDAPAALSLMEGLERFRLPSSLMVATVMEAMARTRRVMRHGQDRKMTKRTPDGPQISTIVQNQPAAKKKKVAKT